MKQSTPLVILSLLCAGSLGAAVYFWSNQQTLLAENQALKAKSSTTVLLRPSPAGVPSPADALALAKSDVNAAAPSGGNQPPARTPEEEARRKEFESKMTALRQKESDIRKNAKLTLLKSRLNLTPEQEELAAAAFQKASDLRKAARENFTPGQPPDFAIMQKMMRSDSAAAEEIRAQLSPEQQTEYDNVRKEERADRAEEQTNRQIGEWQQYLKMTPEQKDAAFAALSAQSLANDPEMQPDAKDFDEVKVRMEAAQAVQRESLAAVLDEAQMATYDEMTKSRTETFGGFGGFGGPGGPGGFRGGRGGPPGR